MSLCVRSFLRSTISFCTTEIRAINPPNAVLPILRKLKNKDHREGPFIKGESFFFDECPCSVVLIFKSPKESQHRIRLIYCSYFGGAKRNRAINPPNAVLPILRKLKNKDHREGPFIKGESFKIG